ncbi:MAG: anaerobic ribonucleoside-triphosphate reductase [Promethearchaeota archaeon]
MHLLPKVFRTEGDVIDFDPAKIYNSILRETGMRDQDAKLITELVTRRIISSGIRFLSGPHIREIVCSILSEQHFERERKLYTRIGMPLMDYEEILEKGPKKEGYRSINPEIIHHWAANQIAEEYTLLRILDEKESRAHLYGDIFIQNLKYFDLRPHSQIWDPRIILKYGLPPKVNWSHCCKSGPAGILRVAVNHLAKWLGMTQGEFSGLQGFNLITNFLAPYAQNLSEEEIKQGMQSLIYEINQLGAVISREIPITTISCSPVIFEELSNIPAIGPYGKEVGVYGDYKDECLKLFIALTEIFREGDYNGNAFSFPKHLIYIKDNWLKDLEDIYLDVFEECLKYGTPYFINLCSEWIRTKMKRELSLNNYLNYGILQNICLNLPRYAYISKDRDKFVEKIQEMMNISSKILIKKYDIIQKRLSSKHLPLCSIVIEGQPLFNIKHQKLTLSFVGLNEAVKILTDSELHENNDAFKFGKSIIKEMADYWSEKAEKEGKNYALIENNSKKAQYRFAKLDLRHFPDKAIPNLKERNYYYTNSTHFRDNIQMELIEKTFKQAKFHPIIQNGVIEYISLDTFKEEKKKLKEIIMKICNKSELASLKFIL